MSAYYPKTPQDVIRRNEYMDKAESEIDAMIRKTVKAINNKLYKLERQGLANESMAYKRLTDWTQNVFDSNRVSTKGVSKTAPKKMKANYLIQLEKYNKWHLTKTQILEDRKRLLSQLEYNTGRHITDDEAREFGKAINLIMRGTKDQAEKLRNLMGSDEIRQMILTGRINYDFVTRDSSNYIKDLTKYVSYLIPDGESISPIERDYKSGQLVEMLQSYDPIYERFVRYDYENGVVVDAVNDEILDYI